MPPSCPRPLLVVVLALAALAGCRSTTTRVIEYGYHQPPRFDAAAYGSYAVVQLVDGRRIDHPAWRIPGMIMVADDRAADLVLELALGPGEFASVHERPVVHHDAEGREHTHFGASGELVIPFTVAIYDGTANSYLIEQQGAVGFDQAVPADYRSPRAARAALTNVAAHHDHHRDALAAAEAELRALYRSEFLGQDIVIPFHLASEAEHEPRIAEAYRELLIDPGVTGAERAAAIYRAIGYDVVDDNGKPDKHARYAVAYGLAATAFILGDFDEVLRQTRIARSFDAGGEVELAALEAAATDLADRLAR